ncbi:MAG TPA: TetR/AcrR family transcriptional regulator [Gaiellaceae bacterium]|nr:TetR/AcrR family transcriptional regulator [Gaiellaceae bacterium]
MRRAALTRERVLKAAIRLADERGIESITMRQLGKALGVEAMSLYNHVANKDDLLDGMVDLILNEIDLDAAAGDWETAMRMSAISAHEAFLRHPWACSLILEPTTQRVIPARVRYMESILGRLRDAGFSAELTYHGYHALDSHILGFTLWEIGHALPPEDPAKLVAGFQATFPAAEFPHLAEHIEQHMTEGSHRDLGEFEFGLGLILDGLKRMR